MEASSLNDDVDVSAAARYNICDIIEFGSGQSHLDFKISSGNGQLAFDRVTPFTDPKDEKKDPKWPVVIYTGTQCYAGFRGAHILGLKTQHLGGERTSV